MFLLDFISKFLKNFMPKTLTQILHFKKNSIFAKK